MSPQNTSSRSSKDLTALLNAWRQGDESALQTLAPVIYTELQRMARRYMRKERLNHTLETGALLNEAYLRLVRRDAPEWQNRSHFYGIAARIMRRVLVDHARSHLGQKHGSGVPAISLDRVLVLSASRSPDIVALDEALTRLALVSERRSKVVELRFFGGLTGDETAKALSISEKTVKREWALAKAWLRRELSKDKLD
jgi:RNA polymerase sigma factor (TIGR02999 family)